MCPMTIHIAIDILFISKVLDVVSKNNTSFFVGDFCVKSK